jgi:uncharacterized membrane protein YphA (DoxX/SURF4 family)
MKATRIIHFILSIGLALFFIYSGIQKFIPRPPSSKPVDNSSYIEAFQQDKFENPLNFKMGVKALKASGFLKMVGVLQILSGLLIIIPAFRLIGLLILLPVTVNIFCFHFFMDNRISENIETGAFLLLNIILVAYYSKQLKSLLLSKINSFI